MLTIALPALGALPARALEPVAFWPLDTLDLPHTGGIHVAKDAGPSAPAFPSMPARRNALAFDGNGSHLRVADSPALRFDHGESITLEAWVRAENLPGGQHVYVIGKGRTETGRENQNWALRLTGSSGRGAKVSFLFRAKAAGADPETFHRWTSKESLPMEAWAHVAIRYTFGEPETIAGFIDGLPVSGRWDLGGPSPRPPVVDDAEVWIGSSRGGDRGNSFQGLLANVGVYRGLVPDATLAERGRYREPDWEPPPGDLTHGKVLTQIYHDAGSPDRFPRLAGFAEPDESFPIDAFALLNLPHVYAPGGVRADRPLPLFVRMASHVDLPEGEIEWLFRAPGHARLRIGGETVTGIEAFTLPRNGHNTLRPPSLEDAGIAPPRLPPGSRETRVSLDSRGGRHWVVAETLLGRPGIRLAVPPFLVAYRLHGDTGKWQVLSPKGSWELDAIELERYRRAQAESFESRDARRRREAAALTATTWQERHHEARRVIDALPPLAIPGEASDGSVIDRLIDAKLAATAAAAQAQPLGEGEADTGPIAHQAWQILEGKCVRCHGEKAKGGLRLDSREGVLQGGESGLAAARPADSKGSELIRRVLSDSSDERMPPKGEGLEPAEIQVLRSWIEKGVSWSSNTQPASAVAIPPRAEPLALLRRIYLDTVGVLPPADTCRAFCEETDPEAWSRLIDRLLEDERHAGHWVSYWQDVLAENPRLVKGKLNNTGPFRWWIYESLCDNKPFDQFVTELVTFAGSPHGGGAAGFGLATQNDVPMAAKAHVLGTAFLGTEMKCARCHDAPYHSVTQADLFSMAALLADEPITLPASSTVPAAFFDAHRDREPLIEASLTAGTVIQGEWPFAFHKGGAPEEEETPGRNLNASAREGLALEITHPSNRRFAQVIVNRIWARYFGRGIVDPVHDWEGRRPSHPRLLDHLAREFVRSGYDLRHLHRLILNSRTYQREARLTGPGAEGARFFEAPPQRRLSAEQLVDSLFEATGVPFYSEELSYDPEGAHPPDVMQSLGKPTRAWQLNAVTSERDRPSLTLPRASSILAVMEAFGWRSNRSEPDSGSREVPATVLQPGMLGNGLFGLWQTRLSDFSELTGLALHAATPEAWIEELYLRLLSRFPSDEELQALSELLAPGFDTRLADSAADWEQAVYVPEVREVTWANHLNVEANLLAAEIERRAAEGPPPTRALETDWRERAEDVIWALVNAPELQFIP